MSSSIIVLAGAGHANIQCLKMLAMKPEPGAEIILISNGPSAPYSGMLPGYMMGRYGQEDIHFNLWKLTSQAGVIFLQDTIERIDTENKLIQFKSGRAPLLYDYLSLNIGITPRPIEGNIDRPNIIPLKPITQFSQRWKQFLGNIKDRAPQNIAVVGAGAAGIETAVAIVSHIKEQKRSDKVTLLAAGTRVLTDLPEKTSHKAHKELEQQGVSIKLNTQVLAVKDSHLELDSGENLPFDYAFLATTAQAPGLIKKSGLEHVDGYLSVSQELQSLSHPDIFGAGDCIHFSPQPLPKAGVFAVREGKVLCHNLRQLARGKNKLRPYHPQQRFLKLINLSPEKVMASRGNTSLTSPLFVRWKDHIDRKFMDRFGDLPLEMGPMELDPQLEINTCGGCGAKISDAILRQVLIHLNTLYADVLPTSREDCSPLPTSQEQQLITVDGLRSFLQDPFLFGKISILHALSDIWASNVVPQAITVSVGLQHRDSNQQRNYLLQLMSGILSVCQEQNIKLSNAHSFENAEDHVSITVVGVQKNKLIRKGGANTSDVIVMKKPLGVGVYLQAMMKGEIGITEVETLLKTLQMPNKWDEGMSEHITSGTDITGFGFIGHLLELLQASEKTCTIALDKIPTLPKVKEYLSLGHKSFLIDENKKAFEIFTKGEVPEVLWDPQTNGSLLATFPKEKLSSLSDDWIVVGEISEGPGAIINLQKAKGAKRCQQTYRLASAKQQVCWHLLN